jgi:hypothetical protein
MNFFNSQWRILSHPAILTFPTESPCICILPICASYNHARTRNRHVVSTFHRLTWADPPLFEQFQNNHKHTHTAIPWLNRLVTRVRWVRVGFVAEKVALGQFFLPVLRFSPVSTIPPVLQVHSSITNAIQSQKLMASVQIRLNKSAHTLKTSRVARHDNHFISRFGPLKWTVGRSRWPCERCYNMVNMAIRVVWFNFESYQATRPCLQKSSTKTELVNVLSPTKCTLCTQNVLKPPYICFGFLETILKGCHTTALI